MRGPMFFQLLVLAVVAAAFAASASSLASVERQSTVRLTTTGRKSGQPRTATIWFVHDRGKIYVQAGKGGDTDWFRNLLKYPEVTLDFGSLAVRGRAHPLDDSAEAERVHSLFRQKYLLARVSTWFGGGFGRGKVVVVEPGEGNP